MHTYTYRYKTYIQNNIILITLLHTYYYAHNHFYEIKKQPFYANFIADININFSPCLYTYVCM